MLGTLRSGVLAAVALAVIAPASAQSGKSAEWWLVMSDDNARVARFVDMASMTASDNGASVSTMIVSQNGSREMQTITVDCEAVLVAPGNASMKEFICGTPEYRERSGLILGMVSPDEMAAILFAGQSGHAGGDSQGIA